MIAEPNPQPIFLFSLPRSGSTLLQRILASHSEVQTASEPWLLLPFVYALREDGIYAEYSHIAAARALDDFCKLLPAERHDYFETLRYLTLRLYRKAMHGGARYFVDKTPRYHLIVDDIMRIFPDAKYIFLWRNPLAIASSIMNTWAHGKWNLYHFKIDLYDGMSNLLDACSKYSEVAHVLRYEDLITKSEDTWHRLCDYLELPFETSCLQHFEDARLKGSKGDPTGVHKYSSITTEPLGKWESSLRNPIRKEWCRRYLSWIGDDRLRLMGYNREALEAELRAIPTRPKYLISDMARITFGIAYQWLEPAILKRKLLRLPDWRRIHAHR